MSIYSEDTKAELSLTKAKLEAQHAMQRVIRAVTTSQPVDPEDIVVIRGSSEQFAELAEAYIEAHSHD